MSETKMRPIRETIPLEDARAVMAEVVRPLERTERVGLAEAGGRVAASELRSPLDVPPFDRAAMDGYAVVAADTFGASRYTPRVLRCLGKIYTGDMPRARIERGTCAEIATGAPMPEGADAVVMVEETERDGDEVRVLTPVYPGQHVGRRGADLTVGTVLTRPGDVLSPSRIGALAAVGIGELDVFARPVVAIVSTGNEIVEPGEALAPGQIYDINRFALTALIREHGGLPWPQPTVADTLDLLAAALETSLTADLVVFSGGSSVGERDLILDVLQTRGEVLFHGIAVKPGKPTVFGTIDGKPVLGMPGYPTSCLSNAYMLLVPLVRRMAHLPPHQPRTVRLPLAQRIVSTTGRHQFFTVRIVHGQAVPAFKASGDITSMAQADGYIEIPAQTDVVEKGELVEVKLF